MQIYQGLKQILGIIFLHNPLMAICLTSIFLGCAIGDVKAERCSSYLAATFNYK